MHGDFTAGHPAIARHLPANSSMHQGSVARCSMQVDVHRPPDLETTSRGAAYAAGIGCGMWTEEWVMTNEPEADGTPATFQPQVSQENADRRYACWKIAVQHSFGLESLAPE